LADLPAPGQEAEVLSIKETSMATKASQGGGMGSLVIDLSALQSSVNMLQDAIKQSGQQAEQAINNAVNQIRQSGWMKDIKSAKEKGSADSEAWRAYQSALNVLRQAAEKGNAEAKNFLRQLGEAISSAGQ